MTARTLNGGQRLWVAIAILLGISLMLVGEKLVPTQETLAVKFGKLLEDDRQQLAELHQRQGQTDAFSQDFFPPSDIPIVEARIQNQQNQYAKEQSSLWKDQLAIRSVFVGIWVALCLALYGVGAVVGWVYRGFRPGQDSRS